MTAFVWYLFVAILCKTSADLGEFHIDGVNPWALFVVVLFLFGG